MTNEDKAPDFLSKLAVREYGDAKAWRKIFQQAPWPKGAHQVELFLGDQSVSRKAFSVN